jgi:3-deoxy-D-manno-octulosonate 8-phosphate phosphatase (KDO 8-P phosphatase)
LVDKCDDKLSALRTLARQQGIELEQIAYIGDDLPDIPPMEVCGLAIAVADAHPKVKQIAQWVTTLKGGQGAVREVCDAILEHLASF